MALVLGIALDADAQSRVGVFRPPAEGQRATHQPPPNRTEESDPATPRYPVAYTLIPAIVMSDGSVYANFGYGYEQVSRSCGHSRVIDGRGLKTTQRYPQQAPAQVTASAQNLPSAQAQRRAVNRAAHNSCYGRDNYGRLVVVR